MGWVKLTAKIAALPPKKVDIKRVGLVVSAIVAVGSALGGLDFDMAKKED
jgi:hypothetical protein